MARPRTARFHRTRRQRSRWRQSRERLARRQAKNRTLPTSLRTSATRRTRSKSLARLSTRERGYQHKFQAQSEHGGDTGYGEDTGHSDGDYVEHRYGHVSHAGVLAAFSSTLTTHRHGTTAEGSDHTGTTPEASTNSWSDEQPGVYESVVRQGQAVPSSMRRASMPPREWLEAALRALPSPTPSRMPHNDRHRPSRSADETVWHRTLTT